MEISQAQMASMIDHTLLKPFAGRQDIIKLCQEARKYNFASVCIHPYYVPLAVDQLQGSSIKVCTVIGFPLGSNSTAVKVFEAVDAVTKGAGEVDMVINIGALKEGHQDIVLKDIEGVVNAVKEINTEAVVKVIIETCYLTTEEKVLACQLAQRAGAHYVKTSTGFGSGGATVEDIMLMRKTVGPKMGIKASGGIKSAQQAVAMVAAGANRIGASAGVAIISEL